MTPSMQQNTPEILKGFNRQKVQQQAPKGQTSSQYSCSKHSINSYITDELLRKSFAPRQYNSQFIPTALLIIVVWSSLLQTCSSSTSTPIIGYSNPQIITGTVTLSTDTLTPSAFDAWSVYISYDFSINIPTSYSTHIGIQALSIQNITSGNDYACYVIENHVSNSVLRVDARFRDVTFQYVMVNYVAIDPNYFLDEVEEVGRGPSNTNLVLSSSSTDSEIFSLSKIQNGRTYKAIKLLTTLLLYAVNDATVGNVFYTVNIHLPTSKLQHVTGGENVYVNWDRISVLVFRLDTTKRTRLQFHTIQATTSGDTVMPITTSLILNEDNTIIGLMEFTLTNKYLNFKFYHNNTGDIWLQNSAESPTVKADIAIIYVIQCSSDSQFYSDTDELCHPCLQNCLRCSNASVCEECAVNYILQNSDSECNCPFTMVSDICHDFDNPPMKGCESAAIDPITEDVICLQCSDAQNLTLSNGECDCKWWYQRVGTDCICPYSMVSGICYDFDNPPMKGCESADIDLLTGDVTCLQCSDAQNLTLSNGECDCKWGYQKIGIDCICPFSTVSGICYDFENSPIKGCQIAEFDNLLNQTTCFRCKEIENLIKSNDQCVCKSGYQKANSTTNCTEVCGDFLIIEAQCDDGNTVDNDGCSSQCLLETGFVCDNSNGFTVCKSQQPLSLSITKMWKNDDNSATFTISSNSTQSLPFDFEKSQFEGSSMLKLTVYSAETNETTLLNTEILSVEGLSIQFLVTFDFTIENFQSQLWLNTSLTKYTAAQKSIQFTSKGENKVLKVTDFLEVYQPMSHSMFAVGIAAVILLFVGLLTPKFIGLQTMLTLSLVYLSQILIVDPENVPVGFMFLEPLKYTLGYSDFVFFTSYSADSKISQKFAYLEFKKTTVENFNSSFVLLVASFMVFVGSVVVRRTQEYKLQKKKQEQKGQAKAQRLVQGIEKQAQKFEEEKQAVSYWTKVNEKCLHAVTQLSFWCILQVFSAHSAQLNISNSSVKTLQQSVLSNFNGLVIAVSLFIIVTVGLTYSFNVYLSISTLVEMTERPSELLYKKMLFVYLFVMAYLIMFCFWVELSHFFCSTAVLAVHLIYMGALIKVHPYQMSLHIHSVGLFSNQVILLVVFLFINALNYFGEFNEVLVLALGFFVVGTCGTVVVIGAVRLYYEYRYGKELQEEIQEERRLRSRKERQRAKKEFNDMQQLYRLEARNRMTPLERIRARNQFLVENQFLEDKKEYFWDYLQSKTHLAKEIKEKHYFDIFDQKPLSWLKIHKPKEYKEEMEALQHWKREYHEKEIKKRNDPEFKALHKRLNNEFRRKKKQAKLNRLHNKFP